MKKLIIIALSLITLGGVSQIVEKISTRKK